MRSEGVAKAKREGRYKGRVRPSGGRSQPLGDRGPLRIGKASVYRVLGANAGYARQEA